MSITSISLVCLLLLCACASTSDGPSSSSVPDELFTEGGIEAEQDGSTRTYPYRLLRPFEGDGRGPRPLLVFLHGVGERGSDNVSQLRYLPTWMCSPEWRARYRAFVLAVQCPDDELWVGSRDLSCDSRRRKRHRASDSDRTHRSIAYLSDGSVDGGVWIMDPRRTPSRSLRRSGSHLRRR